jgi:signal peptidase II
LQAAVLKIHKLCLIILLAFSTIGCDQVTKIAARDLLPSIGSVSYLNNFIRLEYAENTGAFLSFGAKLSPNLRFWIFTVAVSLFMLLLVTHLASRKLDLMSIIAYSLILGGGVGNLIDRLIRGAVIDFLNIGIGELRTGIFNIADVAIVTGVFLLIVQPNLLLRFKTKKLSN